MRVKIAMVANSSWYLANFRLNLAKSLQDAGFEIVAMAPPSPESARLEAAGLRFVPTRLDSKGTNPLRDIFYLLQLLRGLRRERPNVYLGYTIKPNVYGGLVCRLLGIPSVHNISGLGTAFIRDTWVTRLVRTLYRHGLKRARTVFFQNPEDKNLFVDQGIVEARQAVCLPGSGVDLARFAPRPTSVGVAGRPFRFLLVARMLWDKGVGEFVEAARELGREGRAVECQLLGFLGADNPTAISSETVAAWAREGVVRYLGQTDDVRPYIAAADCVVLPSYREGTPRSLLEAAAMSRPIVTTDAVGCREAIDDGKTGFLCRPKDVDDLADKMRSIMDLSDIERVAMGKMGRTKMECQFDERIVIRQYLEAINRALDTSDMASVQ